MIRLDCEQGSPEWLEARRGIPTASQLHRILTPKLARSKAWEGYRNELLAERFMGPLSIESTDFMARGTAMEEVAVSYYEFTTDNKAEKVGFCLTDERTFGASPDRLVGDDGGLEIKVPSPAVHVGYLLGQDSDKYRLQVQGALYVTGRLWWDWLSFHPEMPCATKRWFRDESTIWEIDAAVREFVEDLETSWKRLEQIHAAA